MIRHRAATLIALAAVSLALFAPRVHAGYGITVPVSEELGTSIAGDMFPLTLDLGLWNLYLTEPRLLFTDRHRISLQVRLQAYDHRPAEGIAVSEKGHARLSGIVGYDSKTREILLHEPLIDELKFDRSNSTTLEMRKVLEAAWSANVQSPLRSAIPPHAYTLPLRDNIDDISYDGKSISLVVIYR